MVDRTSHGNFGALVQKFSIKEEDYTGNFSKFKTVKNIVVECPLLEEEQKKKLKKTHLS